jgi:hypothetical protein
MIDGTMKEVKNSCDLRKLSRTTEGVVGKKCWKIAFGYGGELHLHFGAKLPCENPKLSGQEKGEWRFNTCGTSWTLSSPRTWVASSSADEKVLLTKLKVLEDAKVVHFEIGIPNNIVTVAFDNDCLLRVIPGPKDDEFKLPYWELFTPNHMIVSFGPGRRWFYRRSDVFAK